MHLPLTHPLVGQQQQQQLMLSSLEALWLLLSGHIWRIEH